ncbi:TIR domain-containing protein [Lentzea sp. JNUCC 0626]|uniref:TIR domain-containing protein n=1 Tax=Lentzea sp. JNUCC 0626 TaxID=3367513 RepID=UPI003747B111
MSHIDDEMGDEDAARVDALLRNADAAFVAAVEAKTDVEGSLARLKARNQLAEETDMAIFVSYAHSDGSRMASALVETLREHGLDVVWDGDLSSTTPLSLSSWMTEGIRDRTVLCVLSDAYVRAFSADSPAQFETNLLRHRLYAHRSTEACPVVPVAPAGFDVRRTPAVLANLVVHRFDPVGCDVSDLVERLGAAGTAPRVTRASALGLRTSYEISRVLRAEDAHSERAWKLLHELLANEDGDVDLARSFEVAIAVAEQRGDVSLIRQITRRCAAAAPALGREQPALLAKVMIFGKAWYLEREHRLTAALAAAEEGVRLAEGVSDLWTRAAGLRTVARLYLKLAEHGPSFDRESHLGTSRFWITRAHRAGTDEVWAAERMAEWNYVRYLLTGDSAHLDAAHEGLDTADGLGQPDGQRTLMRARITLAKGRFESAASLLAAVLAEQLHPEVEAHGHRLLADVLLHQGERSRGVSELLLAMELFQSLGSDHAADSCWWELVGLAPERVTRVRLNPDDLAVLAELTDDPRIRRRAVEEHAKRTMMRLFPGRSAADWASLTDDALYR